MALKKKNVGDIYTRTKCIDGKKVIITFKVTQIQPVYREVELKREKTNEDCNES